MLKKYVFYLLRWQLSTPILAVVLLVLTSLDKWTATIIANLIGGLIFFWVDKFIFRTFPHKPMWEIEEDVTCADCGHVGRGYRIVEWFDYNRKDDKHPQYRCECCKDKKFAAVRGALRTKTKGKK